MNIKKYIIVLFFVTFFLSGSIQLADASCSLQSLKECDRAGLITVLAELIKYKQLNNKADLVKFKATEIILNNSNSVEFWTQAYCPGSKTKYDYKYDTSRYFLERCEKGDDGSHGGCPTCVMSKIVLKRDLNIELIHNFYDYLNNKDYEEAYGIYFDFDNLGYEFFKNRYDKEDYWGDFNIKIDNIVKLAEDYYIFDLFYGAYDSDKFKSFQKMIAIVKNGKISLVNPDLKVIEEVKSIDGNKKIILKRSGVEELLVLSDNGKESIIFVENNYGFRKRFKNIYFSNNGNYLFYGKSTGMLDGYMGSEYDYNLYDFNAKKNILSLDDPDFIITSKDNKYILVCGNFGYANSPLASIIELERGREVYSPTDFYGTDCSYDEKKNEFILNLLFNNDTKKTIKFNILTGDFEGK
ncbi:MAG: hypothetical protein PHR47_00605 [Candidatus Pacebacteria bacterium]|nr:hypothetical protein [Candidatus Paceibacterota bacterium]